MANPSSRRPSNRPSSSAGRSTGQHVIINIVVFVAVLAVLGSQLGKLSASLSSLRQAHAGYIVLAGLAVAVSFAAAAASYQLLARPKKLRFLPTLAVQTASGVANRLLPAGLGSLSLFTAYYRKQGQSLAAASALATTNNILGVLGNVLLIGAVLIGYPAYIAHIRLPHVSATLGLIFAALMVVALLLLFVVSASHTRRIASDIRSGLEALRLSLRPDRKNALALIFNILLTSLNGVALSLSVSAIGGAGHLGWPAALLVLSFGTVVGAAVPTPGGIGGVEAGLLAGLVAFGLPSAPALAAVLTYRILTYWLPIVPGLLSFRYVEKRYL